MWHFIEIITTKKTFTHLIPYGTDRVASDSDLPPIENKVLANFILQHNIDIQYSKIFLGPIKYLCTKHLNYAF